MIKRSGNTWKFFSCVRDTADDCSSEVSESHDAKTKRQRGMKTNAAVCFTKCTKHIQILDDYLFFHIVLIIY